MHVYYHPYLGTLKSPLLIHSFLNHCGFNDLCQVNKIKNLTRIFGNFRLVSTRNLINEINQTAISSSQNVLKRPRRKGLDEEETSKYNHVFAFATADGYNTSLLKQAIVANSNYKLYSDDDFKRLDILYLKAVPESSDTKEMFIFEGSVVFWNVAEVERSNTLKFIKQFEISSYNEIIVKNEQEMMPYAVDEEREQSDLVNGLIALASTNCENQLALDKYTFSNAMVLSVKLGIWESVLESYISEIELLTRDLKLGNKIRVSRKEVLKKTGELFSLRHSVNLSSDALDIPDFYWDREKQERIYVKMYSYFSIKRRTTVVNEKLNHCLELLDLLYSQLNDKHHVRLEWMIIILIAVEIAIAIIHSFIM